MPGGWGDSDRRDRLPESWPSLVRETKRRAQNRCQWRLKSGKRCPRHGTDVDHKIPGDDHSQENLQLLCSTHHDAKSSKEGNAARWKKIKPRSEGQHPGSVR